MDSSLLIARILYILLCIVFIITVIAFISTIISLLVIDTTTYSVSSSKIPEAFSGYKILQISDLHNYSFGKNNSKLIKKIEKVNPDIIVLTGDMINTNSKNYDNFYSLIENISKKYKIYYIMGNHEMKLSGLKQIEILNKLNKLGITILNNSKIDITKDSEKITVYGLNQPISTYKNALKSSTTTDFSLENMENLLPQIDNNTFNILLTHSPFDFEIFEKWGADLVLSGHVHGGLIKLPFIGGLFSPERTLFPKYSSGEYTINSTKMIVSRGLGNGTINLRIFNNPEICVIELKSKT